MKARLTNNPADREAAEELTRLNQNPPHFSSKDAFDAENKSAESPGSLPARTAAELYATHCEVCHGATGDGHGPSAHHLFPRPRDLRSGTLRLVSTRQWRANARRSGGSPVAGHARFVDALVQGPVGNRS